MHILIRLAKNIYSYKGVGFLTKLGSFIVCLTALKTFFSYVLLENLKLGRREEEIGGGDIDWGLSTLYFLTKGRHFPGEEVSCDHLNTMLGGYIFYD